MVRLPLLVWTALTSASDIRISTLMIHCSFTRAAAVLAALLLSGCSVFQDGAAESIPADAMKRPVDLSVVCLLLNEDVTSEPLVKSLETGVRRFGSEPKLLMPGEGPQACSFVVTYEVKTNARAIEAVRFQTFENSVPALEASGRANPGAGLTADNVAAYMVQLLDQTKKRLGDRAVLPASNEAVKE